MFRTIKIIACLGAVLTPLSAGAIEITKKDRYEFYPPAMKQADLNCQDAITDALSEKFEGVTRLEVSQPHIWEALVLEGVGFTMYNGVDVKSGYGDVTGNFTCTFTINDLKVHEIVLSFEGKGLAGYLKSPLPNATMGEKRTNFINSTIQ